MEQENKPTGRPSIYTPELRDRICAELAKGRTLRSVCEDENMPDRTTIYDWYIHNTGEVKDGETVIEQGFSHHYDHAREIGLDAVADEIVQIADDGTNDFVEVELKKGGKKVIFDREHVQRSDLRVRTRQWYLENMAPRKYGKNVKVQSQTLDKEGNATDPVSGDTVARTVLEVLAKVTGEPPEGQK